MKKTQQMWRTSRSKKCINSTIYLYSGVGNAKYSREIWESYRTIRGFVMIVGT